MDTLILAIQYISKRKAIEDKSTPRAGKRAKKAWTFDLWKLPKKPETTNQNSPKVQPIKVIDVAHYLIDQETTKIADDILSYDYLYADLEQKSSDTYAVDSPDKARVSK